MGSLHAGAHPDPHRCGPFRAGKDERSHGLACHVCGFTLAWFMLISATVFIATSVTLCVLDINAASNKKREEGVK
jgi:hypothetical protein